MAAIQDALDGVFGRREIGEKSGRYGRLFKNEVGDLNPKWKREQGNCENMREHPFGSREID
jgi:hypothetical protein